jgi:hypothetical protein
MATDIVQSLFGVTPEMYQQQQAAAADKRALTLAQLDPMQRAEFNIGRGAYQLAGALGAPDPQLELISFRQSVARNLDPTDPESIKAGIQALKDRDPQGAMLLTGEYRKALESGALVQQRKAERMTPEQRNALAYAATMGEPGSEQFKLAYQAKLEQLTSKEGQGKTPEQRNAEAFAATKGDVGSPAYAKAFQEKFEELIAKKPTANIKEVGVAVGRSLPVYLDVNNNQQFVFATDAEGKQVRKPYVGGVDRTTAKVSATSQTVQENAFSKQLGEGQAKRYEAAVGLRDNAISTMNTFNTLAALDDQSLISGAFASGRVGVGNLLNTLGFMSGKDAATLARSENYQKVAGDAVLAAIGGKLGGQISEGDRKFVERIVPQLENSPAARRELINYMLDKNRKIAEEATRVIDYAETKRTLSGFKPTMPLTGVTSTPAVPSAVSGLTDEELKRRYNEARGKK